MGTIVTASITSKTKLERARVLELLEALAQQHFARGPYFIVTGAGCTNMCPFLGIDGLRHVKEATLLVKDASIEEVRDAVKAQDVDAELAIGFAWVRGNDDWDFVPSEEEDIEEREAMIEDIYRTAENSSDACGILFHTPKSQELRIVGKAAPAELDYGDKSFFNWLAPWLGTVRYKIYLG